MLANKLDDYITELDLSSIKGETDEIRNKYSGTDEGEIVQLILGNFWDNELIVDNYPAIASVLTKYQKKTDAFVSNRFALMTQFRKYPRLKEGDVKQLDTRIELVAKAVTEQVRGIFVKAGSNQRVHKWLFELRHNDIKNTMVSFLVLGVGNTTTNLGAYLLMNEMEELTLNFDSFAKQTAIREAFLDGILRAMNSYTTPPVLVDWLCEEYPSVKEKSIHATK